VSHMQHLFVKGSFHDWLLWLQSRGLLLVGRRYWVRFYIGSQEHNLLDSW
jgi:hypothetical protein